MVLLRVLTMLAAIEMAADVVGLVINPTQIDTLTKTWILTIVLALTLLWDLGAIVVFHVAPASLTTLTERKRRNGIYWTTIAAVVTVFVLLLLWNNPGMSWLLGVILIEVFLLMITISDAVAAYYLLR